LKKNLQTGGKFKPKSSQFFQSVSRKHKLIYVSFFIKIGQWSTKKKRFETLGGCNIGSLLGLAHFPQFSCSKNQPHQ
jgi:hypothetical protein